MIEARGCDLFAVLVEEDEAVLSVVWSSVSEVAVNSFTELTCPGTAVSNSPRLFSSSLPKTTDLTIRVFQTVMAHMIQRSGGSLEQLRIAVVSDKILFPAACRIVFFLAKVWSLRRLLNDNNAG